MAAKRRILKTALHLVALCLLSLITLGQNTKIDSLLTVLKSFKEDSFKVNTQVALSNLYSWRSKFAESESYADSALNLAGKLKFKRGISEAYNALGNSQFRSGNSPQAIVSFLKSVSIKKEIGDKASAINIYFNIAYVYRSMGDDSSALINYLAALQVAKEIGASQGMTASYNNIGIMYEQKHNYPEALKYYFASLKIKEETGDKSGAAALYNNIGNIYWTQTNYAEALKNHLLSLRLREETNNKQGVAESYHNIGLIYNDQGNYDAAIKNLKSALGIFEERGAKGGISNANNSLGEAYRMAGDYPDALNHYQAALAIWEKSGDKEGIAIARNNIGLVYLAQGKYLDAIRECQLSLNLSKEIGDSIGIAESYGNLGLLNLRMGKPAEAKNYLDMALVMNHQIGLIAPSKDVYFNLATLDSSQDNYKEAFENYKKYILYRDSIYNKESNEKILSLQMQYDFDKKEAAIRLADAQTLAEEKILHEKEIARDQLAFQKEKESRDKQIADDNLRFEQEKSRQNTLRQKAIDDARFQQEKAVAEERLSQEKARARTERRSNLIMITSIVLLMAGFFTFMLIRQRNSKRRSIERALALQKMTELELQSLRMQLNPHFMFNSLNAIQELILKEDNENSHVYLSRFSELLRTLLDNANQPFVTLRKEVVFLELYLSLEKLRIPELEYAIHVDPSLQVENLLIPNMMLQPYIENAIWHGLSQKKENKKLDIRIYPRQNSVIFEIEDNGIGRRKAIELKSIYRKDHKSMGMDLLSKRFNLLSKEYGTEIHTHITDMQKGNEASGTKVEITIPSSFIEKVKSELHDQDDHNR